MNEKQIQAKAFQEVWNRYPQTRRLIFHVPNGGSRNKIEGMQLKAQGVVAGIPDILFIWNGTVHPFEFKTGTGNLSPAQIEIHNTWKGQGIETIVIRSPEEFVLNIEKILCIS